MSAGSIRITMLYAETLMLRYLFGPDTEITDENYYDRQRISTMFFAAHLFLYVALRRSATNEPLSGQARWTFTERIGGLGSAIYRPNMGRLLPRVSLGGIRRDGSHKQLQP